MPIQTKKLKNCGVLDEDEADKVTKVWYHFLAAYEENSPPKHLLFRL